jgi:phosphohistidine phosphatase SixA
MSAMTARLLLCLLLLTGCSAVEAPEPEGPLSGKRLVEELRDGGYVIVIRHTATEEGGVDDPTKLAECEPQRELTDEGRQQARDLGKAINDLDIPIGRAVASPYCRTKETAELAFGSVATDEVLLPLPGTGEPGNDEAIAKVAELVGRKTKQESNTAVVTHISVIEPVTGATPDEGGSAVFAPEGDGEFRLVAEVPPGGWQRLLEQL